MRQIDLTGKCGSCWYFHQIEGTASGECRKFPYGDDVCHDPKHPYFMPTRSRPKCKLYRATPLPNADRIRAMSDEELTDFLWHRDIQIVERASMAAGFNYRYDEAECKQNIKDWLKSPAEEKE